MNKLNYLNVGCGNKFHIDWVNVDMVSNSPEVISANLIEGIPFPDESFDVVYHSQVLEHIPKEDASGFIKECFRVLKPNGIIRVVVPDLENIVDEYKRFLNECLENPNELSDANYEWIKLEMFDQTVRNFNGGLMGEYLKKPTLINEDYILDRIGFIGKALRQEILEGDKTNSFSDKLQKAFSSLTSFKNAIIYVLLALKNKVKFLVQSKKSKIGEFRLGGEVHMWMYDRYSLSQLLLNCGFKEVSVKSPFESMITNWEEYELDIKNGQVFDPTSLFMEARKI